MEFFHANVYGELPITKDSVVVDIGANGGVFVAYMLSLGARHVIAVEPGKAALENLRASFEHDKRVTIIPFAMHSLVGSKTLYSIEGNSTMSSFENDRLNKEYTEWNHYEVEVETIDFKTLWDKCSPDRVDLLKFDIEGAEYAVIESVKYEDFARVKNILVEFHANQGRLVGTLKKLTELGFEYELTTQDGVITEDLDRPQGCILARRLS
jgi:FkbM family methyltransferase